VANVAKNDLLSAHAACSLVGVCGTGTSKTQLPPVSLDPVCVGCHSVVAWGQQESIEVIRGALQPLVSAVCTLPLPQRQTKLWWPVCNEISHFLLENLVDFLNVAKNIHVPPRDLCEATSFCQPETALTTEASMSKHLNRLYAAHQTGILPVCSLCELSTRYLQAQVAAGVITTERSLRQVLDAQFCQRDRLWGPLCEAVSRWGATRLLTWLSDNRLSSTAVCQSLDCCQQSPQLSQTEISRQLHATLRAHNISQISCGQLACYAECAGCQIVIDFLQSQVFIKSLDDAEDSVQVVRSFCNQYVNGRYLGLSQLCQGLINLGKVELYQLVSDWRQQPASVCVAIGSCSASAKL
jgi:hypothetical protein